ncbi:MAG TPA: CDP-alcohol phosphatidyltransferase family protein [Sneathiellales bacterium]|nr:CDP-alcohol phosphatidyltransferase family protein [Sneathiellales bacterium]
MRACAVAALCAFLLGLLLPASDVLIPVVLIYLTAQMAYVFDCADGQLARAMGTASKFGDFLDKSVDIVSFTLIFGGYFGFLYRHLTVAGDNANAEIWLLLGFLFLAARTSRFAVWQRIQFEVGDREAALTKDDGMLVTVVKNVMDMQASLFGLLLFPFAPDLCLLLFAIQTVIMAAVYVRYFIRAKHLYDN